jgi:hypothetical protein
LGFLFGIEKNRSVSNKLEQYYILRSLEILDEEALNQITKGEFVTIHDTHWGIESFHIAIKQVCGICRFTVRDSQAIKTQNFFHFKHLFV